MIMSLIVTLYKNFMKIRMTSQPVCNDHLYNKIQYLW